MLTTQNDDDKVCLEEIEFSIRLHIEVFALT